MDLKINLKFGQKRTSVVSSNLSGYLTESNEQIK